MCITFDNLLLCKTNCNMFCLSVFDVNKKKKSALGRFLMWQIKTIFNFSARYELIG